MSNVKAMYSVVSGYYCEQVVPSNNIDRERYNRSKLREKEYNEKWEKQKVDVNKMVDEYAPNAKGFKKGGKFFFEGAENTVICDMSSGYLRIRKNAADLYYRSDGTLTDSNEGTHFKIKKWEEI